MTVGDFIYTTKQPQKYLRHLVFWMAFGSFWIFWIGAFFDDNENWLLFNWRFHLQYSILIEMGYTYLVVYFLLPLYFYRKKYVQFSVLFVWCTLLAYVFYVLNLFRLDALYNPSQNEKLLMGWFYSMNFIINGPPVALAMFLAPKMLKTWYVKMEEKQALVRENALAESQLLKAQVHPHFLFNTLNNIYSFALTKAPDAGGLVLKLADTLRYMINDCEADAVPVEKEIQLIRNYLGLEKVRYGNRLQLEIDIQEGYENKIIAPLLMLPFVENSFKHGVSTMRGSQWIKLELTMQGEWLCFYISNSKPCKTAPHNGKKGIGLLNVQKRLQLLYPGKHHLAIEFTSDVYTVQLQVKLEEEFVPVGNGIPIVHT
jgi:sensor histidine kinase YesM